MMTGVWMMSCPEAMGWEFGDFEKDVSWDLTLGRACPVGGWDLGVLQIPTDRDFGGYTMRSAFVGSDSTVSIVKIVSFSSCRKTKVKK